MNQIPTPPVSSPVRRVFVWMARELPALGRPKIPADGTVGTRIARVMSMMQPSGARTFLRTNLGRRLRFDNSKIVDELGVTFRPVEVTLRDTFNDLIASGKIKP